jgi:peptidoglycan/LPS O-acetylase OafA/YrhL
MKRFGPWTVAATVVAAILYAAACSHKLYEVTSPLWLDWHVALRKLYSVVAFALVGYLARRALLENGRTRHVAVSCVLGVAAYSAAIEVGQFLHGSQEGLGWNAFDTLCGALGGALATLDLMRRRTLVSG